MSMPANMEVISKATVSDPKTNEELTTVIVVVHPEEGRQYTGLDVKWLIEKTERCKSEEDIPQWRSKLSGILHNSAVIIFQRFSKSKNPRDLDIVITLHGRIVALTPTAHPDYPTRMSDLALFIEDRYKLLGKTVDLDHVVDLLRTVLFERMGPHFPNLDKWYYGYLADILTMRYNIDKTEEDVEEVIALRRKVVDLTSPTPVADYVKALQPLAQALAESYRMYKTEKNMDEAIEFQRTILSLTSSNFDGTERRTFLRDHAEFMFARFGTISQRKDDVEEMIGIYEELAEQEQNSPTHSGTIYSHFAAVLHERFRRGGNVKDLERAISLQIQALELQGADHPLRHNTLVLLGYMLRSQFVFTGRKESLDRAINCLRDALKLVPFPHEDRPMVLNNLSIILRRAFEEYDQYHFLREAIELEEEALKLPPTTLENRIASFSNIGATLWARYHRTAGSVDELDAIISFYEKALDLMTDKHPSYPFICGNLGTIMGIRLEKQDDLSVDDLRESIKFIRISLAAFDEYHQENCTMSGNLGVACFRMYNLDKDSSYVKEGVTSFRHAANHPSAPASQKFRAAKVWAAQAEEVEDPSALEAYTTVIQLLPVLVAVNADLETRQQRLKSSIAHTDGMGVAAAAYALKVGRVEDAIQFLEEGRALFWNQALKLRTPLSELKLVHPDLAERFRTISKRLEINSFKNGKYDSPGPVSKSNDISTLLTNYQTSVDLERLKSDWDSVLREIHQQSGFETFLEPSHSTQLALQKLENTLDGPVIMLCITGRISGAIIVTGNKHSYLELCDIDLGQVLNLVRVIKCVGVSGRSQNSEELSDSEYENLELVYEQNPELQTILEVDGFRKKRFLRRRPATASILQYVLKELWVKIGQPIVQFLQLNKTTESPLHVYWCPTGPSTFLPIHAAGIYDTSNSSHSSESLMDYVVSSYVPTLGALVNSFQGSSSKDFQQKFLAVVQPQTLPSALEELRRIEKILEPNSNSLSHLSLTKLGDKPSNPATITSVLDHLSSSSIVHFACHGKQNIGNPLESALILEDGELTLSQIMQVEMKDARLAFLAACETAMGEKEVPDESMHLGAALLFAGFQGVVATMWSIADIDGPTVAEEFYGFLMKKKDRKRKEGSDLLDTDKGARALHHAVFKLRLEGVPLERWVPFVYLGR